MKQNKYGIPFYEVSAKSGWNVKKAFGELIEEALGANEILNNQESGSLLESQSSSQSKMDALLMSSYHPVKKNKWKC